MQSSSIIHVVNTGTGKNIMTDIFGFEKLLVGFGYWDSDTGKRVVTFVQGANILLALISTFIH